MQGRRGVWGVRCPPASDRPLPAGADPLPSALSMSPGGGVATGHRLDADRRPVMSNATTLVRGDARPCCSTWPAGQRARRPCPTVLSRRTGGGRRRTCGLQQSRAGSRDTTQAEDAEQDIPFGYRTGRCAAGSVPERAATGAVATGGCSPGRGRAAVSTCGPGGVLVDLLDDRLSQGGGRSHLPEVRADDRRSPGARAVAAVTGQATGGGEGRVLGRHRRHQSPARDHVVKVLYAPAERAAVEGGRHAAPKVLASA